MSLVNVSGYTGYNRSGHLVGTPDSVEPELAPVILSNSQPPDHRHPAQFRVRPRVDGSWDIVIWSYPAPQGSRKERKTPAPQPS